MSIKSGINTGIDNYFFPSGLNTDQKARAELSDEKTLKYQYNCN